MKSELKKIHYLGLIPNDCVNFRDELITCKISSNRNLCVKIEIYVVDSFDEEKSE